MRDLWFDSMNRRVAMLLAVFFFMSAAIAHRYHAAITTLTRDASGQIEIEHRLFMHDLEPLLLELQEQQINLDSEQGEAALRAYVEARFVLRDDHDQIIALTWVGLELDHTYATIYQEVHSTLALTQLTLSNRLLTEIETQVNTVNWSDGVQHGSLVFTAKSPTQRWSPLTTHRQ